ncbi:MAG: BTAD domain-containing putative transcriptional regulator [Caldilineaceae bacterium]
MVHFTLNFLGQFQVSADKTPITNFHSDKARALLAYLALEPVDHTRSALAALLWPEIDEQYARHNLRNTLYRLRQTLEEAAPGAADQLFTVGRKSVCFRTDDATVDVLHFQTLLGDVQAAAASSLNVLEEAVAHYQGELLLGFGIADAPAFEEWLLLQRELLHQQAMMALQMLATAHEGAGRYAQAQAVVSRLLRLDPYREGTYQQNMRLLAQMGQTGQALQQLEQLRKTLREEMGLEPSPETLALAEQIVAGQFGQAPEREEAVLSLSPNDALPVTSPQPNSPPYAPPVPSLSTLDLRDIPDPGFFFGRVNEQQQLTKWLLHDRCRVVAILGIGGMGKTSLTAHTVRQLAADAGEGHFEAVLWRSLLNAPPLTELLPPLLQTLSDQQLAKMPESPDEQLRLLLSYLRTKRVLLVLDNLESILEPEQAGAYRPGYAPYGQLIQQTATLEHQSCLLLTSRERPRGYARLERDGYPIHALQLSGLDDDAGRSLLKQRGITATGDAESTLIKRYSGNPLALKLVADTVDAIFGGDTAEFLKEESLVFDDIRSVLNQHFARLTELEQQILFWLAIEREATPLATLQSNLLNPPRQLVIVETLRDLQRRSLVERAERGFALQNVVTEYLTDRLVSEICTELGTGALYHLHHHALVKTQSEEYIRQSQIRILLEPVLQCLESDSTRAGLQERLLALIQALQTDYGRRPSYAGGTLLNALIHLGLNLAGVDLSGICLWQADLRNQNAVHLNLADADLSDAVFTQTFGRVEAVAVSPDGQRFAIGGDGGYLRIYETASRQFLLALPGHTHTVTGLAFGPDSNLMTSASHDGTVRLWNLDRQAQIQRWNTQGALLAIGFSPDGAQMISVGYAGIVYLWDAVSGLLRAELEAHKDVIRSLAIHPNGHLFATGSEDGEIRLWELHGGQTTTAAATRERFDQPSGADAPIALVATQRGVGSVIALAFSPDGLLLASGHKSKMLNLWEGESLEPLSSFPAHSMETRSLAFGPESRYLYSGGGGGPASIRIWDVTRNELLVRLPQEETTWSLGLTPDGKTLVSGREDGTVHLWNVAEPAHATLMHTLYGYRMALQTLAWSQCGRWLATGDVHGDIIVWDVSGSQPIQRHRLTCEDGPVAAVAISPDGNLLASASGDAAHHSVRIWDTPSGTQQVTIHPATEHLWLAFAHGGEILVGAGRDGTVTFWQVDASARQPTAYPVRPERGRGYFYLACDRTGTQMATHGQGQTLDVWDIAAVPDQPPKLLHTLAGYHANRCAALDSNGNLLACAGPDFSIALWRLVAPGEEVLVHSLQGHTHEISSVAFSPDGGQMVSCGHDRSVRLWDVETGQQRALLGNHAQYALGVAFSPDGSRVASIGKEGLLYIWNIRTEEQEHVLKAPAPYEGMNITGVTGISEAQRAALKALGAVEENE